MRKASLAVLFLTVFIDLIGFGMVIPFLSSFLEEQKVAPWKAKKT